jgi:hypothetical protein
MDNVCTIRSVTVLLDGLPGDLAPAQALGAALASSCAPSPPVVEVNQADATVINPSTGQPLGGGDVLALAGGPFGQLVAGFLEGTRSAPVYSTTGATDELRRSSDDSLIVSFPLSSVTASHDYLLLEVARDHTTGVLAVVAYGFTQYGTAAAVWYFANVVLPDLGSHTQAWYALEWTDDGDLVPSAGDTFTLLDSGI